MIKLIQMGIGYNVGTNVINKLGGTNTIVNRNVNTAMEVGSMVLPIYAAKKVVKSTNKIL